VRRALPALTLAAALLVAGCGGSDSDNFADDYKPLNDKLLRLGREAGTAVTTIPRRSPNQNGRTFGSLAQDVGEIQQQFDDLDPPDDLKQPLDDLVSGLGDLQGQLENIETEVGKRNLRPAAVVRQLRPSAQAVNRAQDKLARATGAKVGN
jgi:hypothetical protein